MAATARQKPGLQTASTASSTYIHFGSSGVTFKQSFGGPCFTTGFCRSIGKTVVSRSRLSRRVQVKGADAAITASFKNFNGGVPREHVRVAILAGGFVALVDVSANSPRAFERNWPSVSRLLSSLRVNASGVERPSEP